MITPKTPSRTVKIAYLRTLAAKACKTKQWGAEALFRLKAEELEDKATIASVNKKQGREMEEALGPIKEEE